MTEIYHQLGFRYKWNLTSIENDNTGDGVIIGPRYISKNDVINLPVTIRQKSIFDPQFFLPNSQNGKLPTYDFFPQVIADGFKTTDWDEHAYDSAYRCMEFQVNCDFRYLIIPTRFREGMPSDYIERQMQQFVGPFLDAYTELRRSKPLLLQLILTDQMLKDKSYMSEILNWVTGIEAISGIYLIYQHPRSHKQISDIEFLLATDFFIKTLKKAGMIVVNGYMNTESIPLLCSNPDISTIGVYENMRIFNTLSFEEDTDEKRRGGGPNARIYISRLLQWVEYDYLGAIKRVVGNLEEFVDDNQYRATMFQPSYKWHFGKSDPYMHYFVSFSNQFRRLSAGKDDKRVQLIIEECSSAINNYEALESGGIKFDIDSGGRHLTSWLTFLNQR